MTCWASGAWEVSASCAEAWESPQGASHLSFRGMNCSCHVGLNAREGY